MTQLTDEQIRRHRADTKSKALAKNKEDKNYRNRILEDDEDETSDSETGST